MKGMKVICVSESMGLNFLTGYSTGCSTPLGLLYNSSTERFFSGCLDTMDASKKSPPLMLLETFRHSLERLLSECSQNQVRACVLYITVYTGLDNLLERTHQVLGLSLDISEAAAVISMLGVSGNDTIQCEDLEVDTQTMRVSCTQQREWKKMLACP